MKIETLSMGYAGSNTYLLSIQEKMIVIDPCLDPGNNSDTLLKAIGNKNVLAVLLTHAHFDHISAVDVICETYNCDVYLNEHEHDFLANPELNLSTMTPDRVALETKAKKMVVGNHSIGPFNFEAMMTTGHTAHSMSYRFDKKIFDGDFIFAGSIGRCDLPSGDMNTMIASVKKFDEKYKDKSIILYPGHGPKTEYGFERLNNPYVKQFIK
ncbi:MBL fold metallo-hydrolase [Erysipelothrix urinaevulpis]|uniref:MBL fold metallo-hydrolase n=1 Tax=Erysipelothrix urinaevulpis TaxID=2683717 RepID=UPI00135A19AE|nr:MBL fold metallo-hydrolase [Erysipelothrix urinaevulpis]